VQGPSYSYRLRTSITYSPVLRCLALPHSPLTASARDHRDDERGRKGLSDTGYVEGRNVTVADHRLDGQCDRLPAVMADLVRRRVAVRTGNATMEVEPNLPIRQPAYEGMKLNCDKWTLSTACASLSASSFAASSSTSCRMPFIVFVATACFQLAIAPPQPATPEPCPSNVTALANHRIRPAEREAPPPALCQKPGTAAAESWCRVVGLVPLRPQHRRCVTNRNSTSRQSGRRLDPPVDVLASILCREVIAHAVAGELNDVSVSGGSEPQVPFRDGKRVIFVLYPLTVLPFGEEYPLLGFVNAHLG
jgi:hypothetical protein